MIFCLDGEKKATAKTVYNDKLAEEKRLETILEKLDSSYKLGDADQLDTDLDDFLGFSKRPKMTMEGYISEFFSHLNRLSKLKIDDALKGHLLLLQAGLSSKERALVIAGSSGSGIYQYNLILVPAFQDGPISWDRRGLRLEGPVFSLEGSDLVIYNADSPRRRNIPQNGAKRRFCSCLKAGHTNIIFLKTRKGSFKF